MIDDNTIDYESELNKAINELVKLRQKYDELEEDRDYVKSLLDVEFKKRIKLQQENEQYKKNSISLKQLYKILEENKEHFLSLSECFSEKLFIKTIFRNIDEDIESRRVE